MFNKIEKNKIKVNNITSKKFDYSKGSVRLDFTLRTDTKSELKDFLELLKFAQKEVEEEIEK